MAEPTAAKRRGRPATEPIPSVGLADAGSTPERYRKVLEALDAERLTPPQAKVLLDVLEVGLRVADAIEVEKRLVAAEAKALEAARIAASRALPVPAARATVSLDGDGDGDL